MQTAFIQRYCLPKVGHFYRLRIQFLKFVFHRGSESTLKYVFVWTFLFHAGDYSSDVLNHKRRIKIPKSRIHLRHCTSLLPLTSHFNNSAKYFLFNAVITIQGVSIARWLHCFCGAQFHWIQYFRHWLSLTFSYWLASNIVPILDI